MDGGTKLICKELLERQEGSCMLNGQGQESDTAEREPAPVADASAAVSLVLGIWRVFEGVHELTVVVWTRGS